MEQIYKWLGNKKQTAIELTSFSMLSKAIVLYLATIGLYKLDKTGVSSGFLILLSLIAVSLSGVIAPFFIQRFKGYKLGVLLSVASIAIEVIFFFCLSIKNLIYVNIIAIYLVQGIESANYNYELVNIFHDELDDQIETNNRYHILVQAFTFVAPILGYFLDRQIPIFITAIFVLAFQIIATAAWTNLKKFRLASDEKDIQRKKIPIQDYLEALKNKSVVYLNLVRSANGFVFNTWEMAAPILLMTITSQSVKAASLLQTMYETTLSLTFVFSGIFLGKIMRSKKLLPYFYRLVPFGGVFGIVLVLHYKTPVFLFLATMIFGVSVYFFRVGTATIGQIITDKTLVAESILLGDVFSRFVNFGMGSLFFFLITKFSYEWVLLSISILGLIGNMVFVNRPIEAYTDKLEARKDV